MGMLRATIRGAAALLVGLVAVACGGGEDEAELNAATTRSMGAPLQSQADEAGDLADAEPYGTPPAEIVGNRAPRMNGVQIQPADRITAGADVRVVADAIDPDGDPVEFIYTWWVNDEEQEVEGPVFETLGLKAGDTLRVQIVASDGRKESSPTISPPLPIANGAPRITSMPEWKTTTGKLTYQVEAEDPEGDTDLRFALGTAPAGMTISELGGLVVWLPERDQMGVHPIEILVTDSAGAFGSQTFELTLDPPDAAPPASQE